MIDRRNLEPSVRRDLIHTFEKWKQRGYHPDDFAEHGPRAQQAARSLWQKMSRTPPTTYSSRLSSLSEAFEKVLDLTHTNHYRFVDPDDRSKCIEASCREYLSEIHHDLCDVKWMEECEKSAADVHLQNPVLGTYSADRNEIWIRQDIKGYQRIEILLHEAKHCAQARFYGAEKMMAAKKNAFFNSQIETEAERFAAKHFQNARWKVNCRMQFIGRNA